MEVILIDDDYADKRDYDDDDDDDDTCIRRAPQGHGP